MDILACRNVLVVMILDHQLLLGHWAVRLEGFGAMRMPALMHHVAHADVLLALRKVHEQHG
eukprot:15009249-Alexandrium_andersonii.AAC.1